MSDTQWSRASRVLMLAGLFTWLAVGLPLVLRMFAARPGALVPLLAWLAFGAGLAVLWARGEALRRWQGLLVLLALSAATVTLAFSHRGSLDVALLVMVATNLPLVLSWRTSALWAAALTVLTVASQAGLQPLPSLLVAGVLRLGFQAFGMGAIYFATLEARARRQLAQVNQQLRAAQAAISDNARLEERLRIARDLHDTLGHHLTALALNLEVATHLVDGKAATHVATARELSRLLLAEVREVVTAMRDEGALDLPAALRALASSVPALSVHVDVAEGAHRLTDPEQAQVVFRFVQEVVTNTARHAAADNLWIDVQRDGQGLRIQARDDGRGTAELRPGHGLAGMRERLERAGGRLDIASTPGRGFQLMAFVPCPEAPA